MTELKEPFESVYQKVVYKSAYSRWIEEEKRREDWHETVDRYRQFFLKKVPKSKKKEFLQACDAIYNLEIVPSMRCLWASGKALEKEHLTAYNCAYTPVDTIKVFSEIMYTLMCGTGVGFSVENQYISNLPDVPKEIKKSKEVITVADSRVGWAKALYSYMSALYDGKELQYDVSKIRKEGERLKTFGGRASGSLPLVQLFEFIVTLFRKRLGSKLSSIDCHDICCYIANVVVAGSSRRSACISFSDLNDNSMRHAKDGEFWKTNMHRSLANNSAVYKTKPDVSIFLDEWVSLIRSKSGERGIFNEESAKFIVAQTGRRKNGYDFRSNPCNEIILRPKSLCNLTEVIIRPNDDKDTLCKKVRQATILGCLQSTLTDFNFVSRAWKNNCTEERLLGVSLTGLRDHKTLKNISNKSKLLLTEMKQTAIDTAEEWSKVLNINMPTAITCVKPSGTTSQVSNTSSGLHSRYSDFYIRRMRLNTTDKLSKLLVEAGVPYHPEVGQDLDTARVYVFEFPIKSPESSVVTDEVNAIEQLEYYLMLQKFWCEHKSSATCYVKEDEWLKVGNWIYENWNYISGVAFLPVEEHVYKLAPYEKIDEETYEELIKKFPKKIDFSKLNDLENEDTTEGAKVLACSAGGCEI